jgi:hypothetical protein
MAELLKARPKRRKPTGGLPPVLARGTERLNAGKAVTRAAKRTKAKGAKSKAARKPRAKPAKRGSKSKAKASRKGGRRGR